MTYAKEMKMGIAVFVMITIVMAGMVMIGSGGNEISGMIVEGSWIVDSDGTLWTYSYSSAFPEWTSVTGQVAEVTEHTQLTAKYYAIGQSGGSMGSGWEAGDYTQSQSSLSPPASSPETPPPASTPPPPAEVPTPPAESGEGAPTLSDVGAYGDEVLNPY